jgi:WD40 repeat protein
MAKLALADSTTRFANHCESLFQLSSTKATPLDAKRLESDTLLASEIANLNTEISLLVAQGNISLARILRSDLQHKLALSNDPNLKLNFTPDQKLSHDVLSAGQSQQNLRDQVGRLKHDELFLLQWRQVKNLEGHMGVIHMATFSPDGSQILTASGDGSIRIWDTSTGEMVLAKKIVTAPNSERSVRSAQFSQNGKYFVTAANDSNVQIWDSRSGELIESLNYSSRVVTNIAMQGLMNFAIKLAKFSPDTSRVVGLSEIGDSFIWNRNHGDVIKLQMSDLQQQPATCVTFSSDGSLIAIGSGGTGSGGAGSAMVSIWDANSGEHLRSIKGHTSLISSIAFSHDKSRLLTASADQTIRMWDLNSETSEVIFQKKGNDLRSALFSSDEKWIVAASTSGKVFVIKTAYGTVELEFKASNSAVNYAQFSPDDSKIITAGADHMAHLWAPIVEPTVLSNTNSPSIQN